MVFILYIDKYNRLNWESKDEGGLMTRKEKEQDIFEETPKKRSEMNPEGLAETVKKDTIQEPPRKVEIPLPTADLKATENKDTEPQTLTNAMAYGEELTDMQAALKRLFPPDLGNKTQNSVMIARIDPNMFLAQLGLNAVDEIMRSDPGTEINVNLIYQKHYNLLSIGLDGMGRIDALELAGAAREEKRMEKQFSAALAG